MTWTLSVALCRQLATKGDPHIAIPCRGFRGFFGGSWRDNVVDVGVLAGQVMSMTAAAVQATTLAFPTLLHGCARTTATDLVTSRKPVGGAAPHVRGTIVVYGGEDRNTFQNVREPTCEVSPCKCGRGNPGN